MSSSDSDYSIDWLASDEEDAESEQNLSQRPDCVRRPTSTITSSSSTLTCVGKGCPSPPSSDDSQAPSSARQAFCEDSDTTREEEEEEEEKEESGVVGMSDSSTCSSPSSYAGSCDGAEERLGAGVGAGGASGRDKPRHPWGAESPNKRLAHKRSRSSPGPEPKEERPITLLQSEKDRLFASKCMELRSYIPSLSSILNGLRSGRYRERLSSFQESVAMDRIQRIMGVLQNPHMGERYVNIILKVEEMLKSWFPHIKPVVQHTDKHTAGNEMEPLSKKQKLTPGALARPVVMVTPVSGCVVHAVASGAKGALCVQDLTPPGPYSATNLKWLHTSPICSLTAEQAQGASLRTTAMAAAAAATAALPAQHDQDLTQDNSVSSSTDAGMNSVAGSNGNNGGSGGKGGAARGKTDSLSQQRQPPLGTGGRPPLGKINAPCLERLLKATESIITQRGGGGVMGSGWS